jgi:hypothetical protein
MYMKKVLMGTVDCAGFYLEKAALAESRLMRVQN